MPGLSAYSVIVSQRGFECHHCCANNIISSSAVSVALQLCKQLLFPPLICHIRTYFGGWSWQVFSKYEKHTAAAKLWWEHHPTPGSPVASPAAWPLLDGPKGAPGAFDRFLDLPRHFPSPLAWDPFPCLFTPFVLAQTQALLPEI